MIYLVSRKDEPFHCMNLIETQIVQFINTTLQVHNSNGHIRKSCNYRIQPLH